MANLYDSKTVKQLKDILMNRGLDHRAKRKADLIKQLVEDDESIAADDTDTLFKKPVTLHEISVRITHILRNRQ